MNRRSTFRFATTLFTASALCAVAAHAQDRKAICKRWQEIAEAAPYQFYQARMLTIPGATRCENDGRLFCEFFPKEGEDRPTINDVLADVFACLPGGQFSTRIKQDGEWWAVLDFEHFGVHVKDDGSTISVFIGGKEYPD